jgi:cyclic beta-1,2-glucan synthetase
MDGELPLRAELFNIEQLGQHAKDLAARHGVDGRHRRDRLLSRLDDNESVLLNAYSRINSAVRAKREITPAGEWLLDNFHLIEEQIALARRHFPKAYSRELPRLVGGPNAGHPRVYEIALELISHVDGRVDAESLTAFVRAYQSVATLELGELWAIAIMLRLALIENLRRVAAQLAAHRRSRDRAIDWAERMVVVAEHEPGNLIIVAAEMVRENLTLTPAFVAELTRRLRGHGLGASVPMVWLEQRLAEQGHSVEQIVQQETQSQAADQVSIGNSIGSLRFLAAMDWREFVETLSVVEQGLRDDPAYADMDFATRDSYRHAIERIARRSPLTEQQVAQKAVELARQSVGQNEGNARTHHVGYYLIDKGRRQLEQAVGMRLSTLSFLQRLGGRAPLLSYLGAIVLVTVAATLWLLGQASLRGAENWRLWLIALPLLFCVSHLSVSLVNWTCTLWVPPRMLPKLDFSEGIPPACRTVCVVPTIITDEQAINDLLDALEVRFLANRDPNLFWALLTDFRDAPQEAMPEDGELVRRARDGIDDLNARYTSGNSGPFFLLHRPRRWNAQEGVWMGWERKRGKLSDFNGLLRSGASDRFNIIVGQTDLLPDIKYVITLDSDTQLPRDAGRQLVGAIAHPLNQPHYDPKRGGVVEGYSILQPRVGVALPSAGRSLFARLLAGDAGIDPYTRAVSDVYQDVFGEGSFIGKGIYKVDSFEQALKGRFPENHILSHDLLEGCYARAGLVSDVLLYEDFPSRYTSDISRRHRWIRGDWQIAPWLLPRVPGANGRARNLISGLSRWKIFDNLRRSLVPAAMMVLLLLGWLLPDPARFQNLVVVLILVIPALLGSIGDFIGKPPDLPLWIHLRGTAQSAGKHLGQTAFMLVCLPYEAYISLDAILRTAWRLLVTHRRLMEWQTAREVELNSDSSLIAFSRSMWVGPALAVAATVILLIEGASALRTGAPILALWFLSPLVAWWMSRPIRRRVPRLTAEDLTFLHGVARRTWRYFDTFITPADNDLPPDNYQEHPAEMVAHRTSPTNMGISLLAHLGAYDFGYLATGQLLHRIAKCLTGMEKLARFRGHFYNWYETRTLEPLPPLYVSAVDSGNLAGHLLVLRSGILEIEHQRILAPQVWSGLTDTLGVLRDVMSAQLAGQKHAPRGAAANVEERVVQLQAELHAAPETLAATYLLLQRLALAAADLIGAVSTSTDEVKWWIAAFERQCRDALDDLTHLAPWVMLAPPAESNSAIESTDRAGSTFEFRQALDRIATLSAVANLESQQLSVLESILEDRRHHGTLPAEEEIEWSRWRDSLVQGAGRARERLNELAQLAARCSTLADVDFDFLYDKSRHLLSIGYNVTNHRLDTSYYDLLASEARFASYIAISQNKLPQEHWFAMSRLLTATDGGIALLSWSGSMFEYLMPLLVMPTFENTLLDETCRAAVRGQIRYGRQRSVPWGISESCYYLTDTQLVYQYRAFGIPGLGLKRGLGDDLVVAPYASCLALTIDPEQACANLRRLADDGRLGAYGFYEAIDYTPARLSRGQTSATVRAFMAHHQGMSLLSCAHLLLNQPMQRRFESDPLFRSAELLLHERIPKVAPFLQHTTEAAEPRPAVAESAAPLRSFRKPATAAPEVHLLSNGRYHVMVTESGGGYSRYKDFAVTRWREDSTRDCWGLFAYVRDLDSGRFWSVTHQPTVKSTKSYEAVFSQGRADYRRRDENLDSHMEIAVSPEDDIEVRRISIANHGDDRRRVDLTSYAEVVLAPPAAEAAHPVFANLFVQSEIVPDRQALLCTRRPRSAAERPPWMLHLMAVSAANAGEVSYETDRAAFVGRGQDLEDPAAMHATNLQNSQGAVLDPIVAIRRAFTIEPDETVVIDIVTGVTETREAAQALIEKYHDRRLTDRVFELAWTHSQVVLRQLDATEGEAQVYGQLASSLVYASPIRRAPADVLARNRRGQPGLWGYGISGDFPIVLVRVSDVSKIEFVRQCVRAYAYWRMKGLAADLVILNEDTSGYRQNLHDQIIGMIAGGTEVHMIDRPGGIFVRRADQITDDDKGLLQTVARVILSDSGGSLAEQAEPRRRAEAPPPQFTPLPVRRPEAPMMAKLPSRDLAFFNGLGGFTRDGREYIIALRPGDVTPAPWSNVLANADFGTVVTESGGGYTWAENAHEFRLTPWYNDAVTDVSGEAFYIRDEETGRFWSPTPLPARGARTYTTRHGFGYSVFEYAENGISSAMSCYVAVDAPVKFIAVKIRNDSNYSRRLSLTGFVEWVLGEQRAKTMMHVITEIDSVTGAMLARNPYNAEFPARVAFLTVSESSPTVTGSRTEFLGRTGSPAQPAAMYRSRLSGRVGAGLDPCGAMQVILPLAGGQEREVVFMLGAGRSLDEARGFIQRFKGAGAAKAALEGVRDYWNRTLGAVHIETPDPSVDILVNGWLIYQVLACRLWARSGFYQSGGAFGFRDQLQDVMALLHTEPRLARDQLLLCASRQFPEGDVQHWWHPPLGRGVRTHISDDYLWLPYATSLYVRDVGDTGVLDERVHFLDGRPLRPDEEGYYDLPVHSEESATLYEHCVRAIRHGLKLGLNGLPLMGTGDWNDGMNLVGAQGMGESVWLALFQYDVLTRFAEIAARRDDSGFAQICLGHAAALRQNVEQHAWDGQWYRRAYFDNGEPLGSALSPECQIDSLPQSWAVLSGAGDPLRNRSAMEAVDARLVSRDAGLIKLFDPPFDHSHLNPGYIKGYIPGVRENGGQYTHAAIWTVMAFAAMGDAKKAWELLSLLNPINHGSSRDGIDVYKVEPYVIAADVYANPQHLGRGGWTWYTGSAGWMYRLIIESLLGLRLEVDHLRLQPLLPMQWKSLKIHYRYRETLHHILIRNNGGKVVTRVVLDGVEQPDRTIPLLDDRLEHRAEVDLG